MTVHFLLRPSDLNDAEQIAALRKRVDQDKKNKYPPLDPYGGIYPSIVQQRSEIAQSDVCFVALAENQIVAWAFATNWYQSSGEYRIGFTVDHLWRGHGIGTALASQLLNWKKMRPEVKKLSCQFARADKSKRRVLEKLGFEVVNEGWVYFMQGAMYNATEMVLAV
jgi:GNAT superfamily N-acetyltransferase